MATDAAGNVYFASDNCVFKLDQSGILTRAAELAARVLGRWRPSKQRSAFRTSYRCRGASSGVAVDGAGNLFIADAYNNRIRKVTPAGIISTIAGNGGYGFSGDGGPAASAELSLPYGVALDGAGNLYIVDSSNNRIRKETPAESSLQLRGMAIMDILAMAARRLAQRSTSLTAWRWTLPATCSSRTPATSASVK